MQEQHNTPVKNCDARMEEFLTLPRAKKPAHTYMLRLLPCPHISALCVLASYDGWQTLCVHARTKILFHHHFSLPETFFFFSPRLFFSPLFSVEQLNMNGEYPLSATPGSKNMSELFPNQYRDYPGGAEMFEVYSPPITTLYSQVSFIFESRTTYLRLFSTDVDINTLIYYYHQGLPFSSCST